MRRLALPGAALVLCSAVGCSREAAPATIHGEVGLAAEGRIEPLAGAVVSSGPRTATTDAAGRFTLPLPAGKHNVEVRGPRDAVHASDRRTLTVAAGEQRAIFSRLLRGCEGNLDTAGVLDVSGCGSGGRARISAPPGSLLLGSTTFTGTVRAEVSAISPADPVQRLAFSRVDGAAPAAAVAGVELRLTDAATGEKLQVAPGRSVGLRIHLGPASDPWSAGDVSAVRLDEQGGAHHALAAGTLVVQGGEQFYEVQMDHLSIAVLLLTVPPARDGCLRMLVDAPWHIEVTYVGRATPDVYDSAEQPPRASVNCIPVVSGGLLFANVTRALPGAAPQRVQRGPLNGPARQLAPANFCQQTPSCLNLGILFGPPGTPVITALSPSSAAAGSPAFTLTVTGGDLDSTSKVFWEGAQRPTTFVSVSELRADIAAAHVVQPGVRLVRAETPRSGASNDLVFTVRGSGTSSAGVSERASTAIDGGTPNGQSGLYEGSIALSADGGVVAFGSQASNLVGGSLPGGGHEQVYVRDIAAGATAIVSTGSAGPADGTSTSPALSADGRLVAFASTAGNLGDNLGGIFLRDRQAGTTERVSIAPEGNPIEGTLPAMSSDGRYVAFACDHADGRVCIRDRTGATTKVLALRRPDELTLSGDGSTLVIVTTEALLPQVDSGNGADVYAIDVSTGTPTLVSAAPTGLRGDADSNGPAAVSDDGRHVAFDTSATNLVQGISSAGAIVVRDTCRGASGCTPATRLVSMAAAGTPVSGGVPSISANGRYVAFNSSSGAIVAGDSNGKHDIFVRDTCAGAASCTPSTTRASLSAGAQPDADCFQPKLSADGRWLIFSSAASNLSPGDGNSASDVFRARTGF